MNPRLRNSLQAGAALLVVSLMFSQASFAQSLDRDARLMTVTRTIDITGLDLSSQAGARRLYMQIVSTAKGICWGTSRAQKGLARIKENREQARRCMDEAVGGALAQVTTRTGVDLARVAGIDRADEAALLASR